MNVNICDACGCSMDEKLATTINGSAMRGEPAPVVIDMSCADGAVQAAITSRQEAGANVRDSIQRLHVIGNSTISGNSIQITSSAFERRHLGTGRVEIDRVVMTCDERSWRFHQLTIGNRWQEPFMPPGTSRWNGDPPITVAQFGTDATGKQRYEPVQRGVDIVLIVDYIGDNPVETFECKVYGTYHPPLTHVASTICVTCAQPLLRALETCDASKRAETALAVGKQVVRPPSDAATLAAAFQNLGRGAAPFTV